MQNGIYNDYRNELFLIHALPQEIRFIGNHFLSVLRKRLDLSAEEALSYLYAKKEYQLSKEEFLAMLWDLIVFDLNELEKLPDKLKYYMQNHEKDLEIAENETVEIYTKQIRPDIIFTNGVCDEYFILFLERKFSAGFETNF